MPSDCPCSQWTCVDAYSLVLQAIGAHHPLCGRAVPLTSDEQIDGLLARVNALETEVNRLKAECTHTLIACIACGKGVRARYAVAGMCSACAEAELARLKEAAEAGWKLSTYAATIHWDLLICPGCNGNKIERDSCLTCDGQGRVTDRNTPEWLDGLRERIEAVQGLAKGKGVNTDG